jgi:hypothetical protein
MYSNLIEKYNEQGTLYTNTKTVSFGLSAIFRDTIKYVRRYNRHILLLSDRVRNGLENLSCSFPCTDITISCKDRLMHFISFTPLYRQCVTPTCFSPQRAILREYDWYISTVKSTKYVTDVQFSLITSVYYAAATTPVAAA